MMINQNSCICIQDSYGQLRPYEKCLEHGSESLTDAELLGVILRTGTNGMNSIELAENVFEACDSEKSLIGLLGLSIPDLIKIKGIGKVKAVQIKCICELSRRIAKKTAFKKIDFSDAETIAQYYMQDLRHLAKEHMIMVMLDTKCRMIRDTVISVGTVNSSLVTPREIFIEALRHGAVSIILLHNHPSGDCTPSHNDIAVTQRLNEAGKLLGINLLDHIIIGENTYTSLREKDLIY